MAYDVTLQVAADRPVGRLPHFWNGVFGEINTTYLRTGRKLLETISRIAPDPYYRRTMGAFSSGIGRQIGAFSSTNVYHEDADGNAFYDFELFDAVFDPHVELGLIPYVAVNFMPLPLSRATDEDITAPWQRKHAFGPKDYGKWRDLVTAVVRHGVDRYGAAEVARWCWEMWNEPDLRYYWMDSIEDFCRLYDHTAAAIKEVLPAARVGGNAVAGFDNEMFRQFLVHCTSGANAVTGGAGAPLDFISFHVKGGPTGQLGLMTSQRLRQGYPVRTPSLEGMIQKTLQGLEIIASVGGLEGVPVHLTECDIDWGVGTSIYADPNMHYRNSEYFAAFQAALCRRLVEVRDAHPANPIELTFMDTFYFEGTRIFEGARTLITADGVDKPVLNALRVLGRLGRQRLEVRGESPPVAALATRSQDGAVQVMACNFTERFNPLDTIGGVEEPPAAESEVAAGPEAGAATVRVEEGRAPAAGAVETKAVELVLTGMGEGPVEVEHFRIDREHSNAYRLWQRMGSPLIPDDAQLAELHERMGLERLGEPETLQPVSGTLRLRFDLPPHSVSLLVIANP